jgi:hypothetical protein
VSLPSDGLGSVFDPHEAQPRIEVLLKTLLRIGLPKAERFAVAARLSRTMLLSVGSSDAVGRRNSSTSIRANDQDIQVGHDEDVSTNALNHRPADVAEELVARLMAQLSATR